MSSIGRNLQPFTGNGDVSKMSEKSSSGVKNSKQIYKAKTHWVRRFFFLGGLISNSFFFYLHKKSWHRFGFFVPKNWTSIYTSITTDTVLSVWVNMTQSFFLKILPEFFVLGHFLFSKERSWNGWTFVGEVCVWVLNRLVDCVLFNTPLQNSCIAFVW